MITFKEQQKKDVNEFLRTTKNHKISICQNTKLFTHIKVKQPNTNNRSYEIIIIPGYLFFIGDMGSYTFKKTFDMKNFHRISWDKQPIISYDKLAKACQSIDKFGDVTEFNNAAFKLEARKCLRDSLQGNPQYRDHYRDFKSAVLDQDFPTYKEAMFNLSSWYYIGPEGTRENPFDDFLPRLKTVVFQQQLGTLFDKVERLETLAVKIGKPLGVDGALCERAARLSKCDLMSEMVGEFPDLQGVMGRYYASAQNEDAQVAEAIDAQYQPRFAGDTLPESGVAQALAIADKLDTITGIYGVGQLPTGDKDPFALRRAALGLLRIMIEKNLDLDLRLLITFSLELHEKVEVNDKLVDDIYDFKLAEAILSSNFK